MKRIILTAVGAYALGLGSFAVFGTNEQPTENGATRPLQVAAPTTTNDETQAHPVAVRLEPAGVSSDRTPVPRVDESDLVDAIASALAEQERYAALIASDSHPAMLQRMEQAEAVANVLQARVEHLERELARAALDPSTPYGHFALLPEVAEADTRTLQAVQSWLERFPVMLAPHEAEWLVERHEANDWRDWPGHGTTETVIAYLNPDRLADELPPARVAELVAYYADEPWVFPTR